MAVVKQPTIDGRRAWCIMFAGCVSSLISHGVPNAMGVLFVHLQTDLHTQRAQTALLVGLPLIVQTMCGPLSSLCYSALGSRQSIVLGGCVMFTACTCAMLITHSWHAILVMVGIGLGSGIIMTPQIAVQTEYFDKYARLSMVLLSMGAALGLVVLSPWLALLSQAYGWRGALLLTGALCLNLVPLGLLMKPYSKRTHQETKTSFRDVLDIALLKEPLFLIFMLLSFLLFGGIIVYMSLLTPLVVEAGHRVATGALLLSVTGTAGILGRISAVIVAKCTNIGGSIVIGFGLFLCSAQLLVLGSCSAVWQFLVCSSGFGLGQGLIIAYGPPTMLEVFGGKHKFHRIFGMSSFFIGLSILAVPQLSGLLAQQSLALAFRGAGLGAMLGGVGYLLIGIHLHVQKRKAKRTQIELEELSANDIKNDF